MHSFVARFSTSAASSLDFSHKNAVVEDTEDQGAVGFPTFSLPAVANPSEFLRLHTDDHADPDCKIKIQHGTTTLAFRFQGGIIVAVDSRATGGSYIASGTVKKVIEINKYLLGTMAGTAADCQYWETYLGIQCRLYELREGQRISVAAASKYLVNLVRGYKGMGISMGDRKSVV